MIVGLYTTQSLANSWTEDVTFSFISLIYTRNIRGAKTMPCSIPDLTGIAPDDSPSTITLWYLFVNQEEIHQRSDPRTP